MATYTYKWPPLESDPEIFNNYFHEIGLPEYFGFQELITLNNEDIQNLYSGFPIFGVLAAIRRPKGKYFIQENLMASDSIPFFMRQTLNLDNACGLIATLHLLGNLQEEIEITEKCILKDFFYKCKNMNELKRAEILEDYNELKQKHFTYSQIGLNNETKSDPGKENEVPTQAVVHHFISFLNVNNNLVELDGTLEGPVVVKKNSLKDNLLFDTIEELKSRITNGYIGEDLSLLFITYA